LCRPEKRARGAPSQALVVSALVDESSDAELAAALDAALR
jgi:hypothetical protein